MLVLTSIRSNYDYNDVDEINNCYDDDDDDDDTDDEDNEMLDKGG